MKLKKKNSVVKNGKLVALYAVEGGTNTCDNAANC